MFLILIHCFVKTQKESPVFPRDDPKYKKKLHETVFDLFLNTVINFFSTVKKNCADLYKSGQTISGAYTIDPDGSGDFDVFCDQITAGGGWTVFQKRLDGSVDFYRGWADYKRGFGNLNGEFWLGLDKINRLTKTKNRLRVDLEDTASKTAYAEYDMFAVTSEWTKYKLSLGTYSGKSEVYFITICSNFDQNIWLFSLAYTCYNFFSLKLIFVKCGVKDGISWSLFDYWILKVNCPVTKSIHRPTV